MIGAGFTGLSAALELAARGFSVVILEKSTVAGGASGRNGGHITRGFDKSPDWLAEKYGMSDARFFCDLTLEGLALILQRMAEHDIKCDLKFGSLVAALDDGHMADLKEDVKAWQRVGHDDFEILNQKQVQDLVKAKSYTGGLFDPKGAHFHPLNYALGVAQAAQKFGAQIYEDTRVTGIIPGEKPKVLTEKGSVTAKFVVLGGVVSFKGAESAARRSITATAHMIATEPLGERRARNIMSKDVAVTDARFIMDYYRFSGDYRLLFGGNCNYSDAEYPGEDQRLRQRMIKLFPSMQSVRIDHCWRGPLDLTINRLPDIGRLSPQIYYAHGFGGHGVIATNIAGKVIAEAIRGQAQRFDVFGKIKHAPFIGGALLKRPLFVLGMMWYMLRDKL